MKRSIIEKPRPITRRRGTGAFAASLAAILIAAGSATAAVPPTQGTRRPNLLLITIDTTRADHLGLFGAKDALTPVLDELGRRGTVFDNAYTSCPLTAPSHATIHTGLQPPEHGLRINGASRLDPSVPTLAEAARASGYRTGAFVAAFVLNHKFGLDQGFDRYDDDLTGAYEQQVKQELSRYRPANIVVDSALAWLGEATSADKPFFAWVHLYDAHFPHFAHKELADTRLKGVATYDAEIAFVDLEVGRLLEYLRSRSIADNTLVIVAADHGEGLGDHGDTEHGHLLNQEVLHVPLIFSLPGRVPEGQRIASIVSLRDIYPTVRELLSLQAAYDGEGRSLARALKSPASELPSEPSFAESQFPLLGYGWSPLQALTTDTMKYIRSARPELYDRSTDPAEMYNLATVRAQQVADYDRQLAAVESKMHVAKAPDVALESGEKARLAALGYVASDQGATTQPDKPRRDIKDMLEVKDMEARLNRLQSLDGYDRTRAMQIATEMVKRSPETATFQNRLGGTLLDLQRYDDAVAPLVEALRLNPDLAPASLNLGRVLAAQGKPAQAVERYKTALRLEPDNAEAHFSLGLAFAQLGQRDSAAGELQEALRLRPDYAQAAFRLARVLASRGYTDAAIARYRQSIEIRPKFAAAHYALGNLLGRAGKRDEAIAQYRAALEIAPNYTDARNNLAIALAESGDTEAAEKEYREAMRRQPDFARAYLNLGNLLSRRGDVASAIASYQEAIRLKPDWSQPLERLAWLLATCEQKELRDPPRAIELAEKATKATRRNDAVVLRTLSAAYAAAGRKQDAIGAGNRALALARLNRSKDLEREISQRLEQWGKPPGAGNASAQGDTPGEEHLARRGRAQAPPDDAGGSSGPR